jgi:predicted DNA-binding protein
MPQDTTTVRIDAELVARLRDFSKTTGIPITRCIEEAIATWLRDVAPARLKAFGPQSKKH